MRQSFPEPFARPGRPACIPYVQQWQDLPNETLRVSIRTGPGLHGLGTRTFLTEDEKRDKTSQTEAADPICGGHGVCHVNQPTLTSIQRSGRNGSSRRLSSDGRRNGSDSARAEKLGLFPSQRASSDPARALRAFQALRSGTISRKSWTSPITLVGATPRSRSKRHGKEIVMRERHQRPRLQDCAGPNRESAIGITVPGSVAVVPRAGQRAWFPPEPSTAFGRRLHGNGKPTKQ